MPREGAGLGQVRREAMPEPSLDSSSSALPTGLRQAANKLADSFFFFFLPLRLTPKVSKLRQEQGSKALC